MAKPPKTEIPSRSGAWLRAILASTLDPVVTIDEYGIIQLVSDSVMRVFGWTPEELVGQNIKILMPEPHRSLHDGYLENYRRTGETFILGKAREFDAVRKDGNVFPCEISVSRVDHPSPSEILLTGIIRDISERKEAQHKLELLNRTLEEKNRVLESIVFNAEKLASMGKLAASIAHEIRNPLTSLKVRLFSIRRAIGPNPALEEKFRVVSEEIDRLEGVVRNFLEFSRPPALKLQPQEVSALIDRTLALCGHQFEENEIEFACSFEPDLPAVFADMEQLKQVLMNLLSNALEAMDGGGRIRVSAVRASDPKGKPMVVLRVEDSGPGIPDDVSARIFEPFFSTKEEGTGLGLCISAQIVERHGGKLVLESSGPEGTCFALWIPVANQ